KGKLIRRQDLRPTVGLVLTGPGPLAKPLQRFEYENSGDGCRTCRGDRGVTLGAAKDQQHRSQPVPQPAVSRPRGGDHPIPNPPWRSPAVHPPHHPMIAAFDAAPEVACDGHRDTSSESWIRQTRIPAAAQNPDRPAANSLDWPPGSHLASTT